VIQHHSSTGVEVPHAGRPAEAALSPRWVTEADTAPLSRRVGRVAVLAVADLVTLVVAGTLTYLTWALPVRNQSGALYVQLTPLLILFLLGFAQAGLYPGLGLGPVERFRRYTYSTVFVFLLLAAAGFALKLPHRYSRMTFGLALVLSLVFLPIVRSAVLASAGRMRWWRERVVVVGSPEAAETLAQRLDRTPGLGYRAVACLPGIGPGESGAIGRLNADSAAFASGGVRHALVCAGERLQASELELLQAHFERVIVAGGFGELPVEGAVVRDLGGVLGIEYTSNLLRRRNRWLKRSLDLTLGGFLLVASAPAVAIACALIKMASPGPAFFVQERAGYGGRRIGVPKIRTMHVDAEGRLEEHLRRDAALDEEWRSHLKLRQDPRLVPGLGRWLRRLSVDELPQLWSVMRGDMSLVGPRPFPDYHLGRFPAEFLELRQRVRPGITGLWQVMVRSAGTLEEQQALDTYYIRNWSVWLDLYLLARTAAAVLSGRGAY
jgi:Undecaprenyl-phosphate galactose phosphotransferase WbaP